MKKIYPVILAGGYGTRLWPLSRKSFPKQFTNLTGEHSLFQQTALRLMSSDQLEFALHTTLTHSDFRFIVGEQLQAVGIDPGHILIEPEGKNTAPAILAACLSISKSDPDAILLVAPSDHIIPDTFEFHRAILTGLSQIKLGKMVTFGITPTHPETGYGYLELDHDELDSKGTANVVRFVEKPGLARAEKMLENKNYLWNAGIFLFKATDMISAFEQYEPLTLKRTKEAIDGAQVDLDFLRLNAASWGKLKQISIDYAIMEKVSNLVAVPYLFKWSDLGGWNAVWLIADKDEAGNALSEGAHSIDCSNTLLRSESQHQKIVGLGLDNIIAIAMPDAVLVADKQRSQEIKKVVELLKFNNIQQAGVFPKDHRPWGFFESLVLSKQFQVKYINVNPGAALSLQSHRHRSEHWIVVEGTARVTVDKEVKLISEGQSVYIPLGAKHRLENPLDSSLVLIEVQTGTYFGEDDIVRYEDLYKRGYNE